MVRPTVGAGPWRHSLESSSAGGGGSQFGRECVRRAGDSQPAIGPVARQKCVVMAALFDELRLARTASARSIERTVECCRPAHEELRDASRVTPCETGWRADGYSASPYAFASLLPATGHRRTSSKPVWELFIQLRTGRKINPAGFEPAADAAATGKQSFGCVWYEQRHATYALQNRGANCLVLATLNAPRRLPVSRQGLRHGCLLCEGRTIQG